MARGRAVIVHDGAVALIERRRAGRTYFVFPGGGAEPGESPAEAARREAEEELGLQIEVGELLAEDDFEGEINSFFAARVLTGEFGSGRGEEMTAAANSKSGSYTPIWIALADLPNLPILPPHVATLVRSLYSTGTDESPGS